MRRFAVVLVLLVTACKGHPTCERFVDMSMKCPDKDLAGLSGDERSQVKSLLMGTCENAMNDSTAGTRGSAKEMMKEINATVRKRAECIAAAADCAAARLCEAKPD